MSYQRERDQFIATMTREGLPFHAAQTLLREATGLNRRAELSCSSEAADRDRVPCPAKRAKIAGNPITRAIAQSAKYPCLCDFDHTSTGSGHQSIPRITLQDWRAEQRIRKVLAEINVSQGHYTGNETQRGLWAIETHGDPRGYVLRIIPPSYYERNAGRDEFNRDAIGVPSGPSRLRW